MSLDLSKSWALLKASAAILRDSPRLLLFPLVSTTSLVVVAALLGHGATSAANGGPAAMLALFATYMVTYFVIYFFNSALVAAAMVRLRGGTPTFGGGLRAAAARTTSILGFAVISATVGVLLNLISERIRVLGQIMSGVLGGVWSVMTYFTVPVLVNEGVGPLEAVRRSKELLAKNWGQGYLVSSGGIALAFVLLALAVSLGAGGLIAVLFATGMVAAALSMTLLGLGWFVLLFIVGGTLGAIFKAAVYCYAVDGTLSDRFNPDHIRSAFRIRGSTT